VACMHLIRVGMLTVHLWHCAVVVITIIIDISKNAQLTINRHKGTRDDTETKPNAYTSTFSVNA